MKRIGIWLRVSTEDQVKGESPEHHEARARAYATAKEWAVVEVYRLDAFSGKSVKHHPEARRMLADVRRGHITGLVFSKLARLARNTKELLEFADEFRASDADLISLQEAIDTSTAAGRLFYTIIGATGQWEREETAERVAASVPVRAKMGKPLGGKAVFGYHWVEGKLIPHPDEAPIRRLIYELFLEHKRSRTVARILNERGYRTSSGGKFSANSVSRLITDTTAKGVRTANRCKSRGDGQRWDLKPEKDWVQVPVEAIVPVELWEECNTIRRETGSKYKKHRGRKPTYLFAGFLLCGNCATTAKMYRQTGWNKYRCYKCTNKIAEDDLESIFLDQVAEFLVSDEKVEQMLDDSRKAIEDRQRLADGLVKDRKGLGARSDTLIDLYQKGGIDLDEFKRRNDPIKLRLSEIEIELAKIENESRSLVADTNAKRKALADGTRLREEWPRMNFDQKRRIVECMVDHIRIAGDEITLNLNYLPGSISSGGSLPLGGGGREESLENDDGDRLVKSTRNPALAVTMVIVKESAAARRDRSRATVSGCPAPCSTVSTSTSRSRWSNTASWHRPAAARNPR